MPSGCHLLHFNPQLHLNILLHLNPLLQLITQKASKRIHLSPPQPSASPQLCTPLQSCHSTSTCYFTSTCYSTSTCSRHRNPRVTRTPTPLQVRLTFFSVPRLIMVRLYLMVTLYLMVRLYLMVAPLGGVRRSQGSSMHMRCPDGIGREIWDREGRESEGGSRHPSPLKGGGSPSRGVSPGGKERSVPTMRLLLLLLLFLLYVVVS